MDHLSTAKRSELMAKIGSKNTKPKMFLRKLLWNAGYRYRLHVKSLPGKPDIVFKSRKSNFYTRLFLAWTRLPKQLKTKVEKRLLGY